MNKVELEVALIRKGTSIAELSDKIGINRTTMYRKLSTGKFDRSEIVKIRDELGLTDADMLRIFFNDESCENSTERKENEDA